jgi:hypothetical protein
VKRRHFVHLTLIIFLVGAAWLLTRSRSALALQKELEAQGASQKGFVVTVEHTTCWFPLIFQATWDYQVPDVESGSAKGWYFLTPWKVYTIKHESIASL